MNEALALNLRSAKLKVTPQRMAIYSYLVSTDAHPSVETIYNAVKSDNPSISLATVYKNLATLRDANLIVEFNVGEDSHRYDVNTKPHTHLVCKQCHNVYDYFENISLDNIIDTVENKLNFSIEKQEVNLYGICDKCKS